MCGIAGIWEMKSGRPVERALIERMVGALHHRGPDAQDVHLDGDLALGHARLSIIDLSGGRQPMCNEDGSLWVTFNGEIYNYRELRAELMGRGHTFKTQSDTEVILHLYEERGRECVNAFNGQFAFAIWDRRKRELFLARDRMGVRPIFYAVYAGRLLFASEIKALFEHPSLPRELDPIAIAQTFALWFPLAPRTGFQGVNELPPGSTMTVNERGVEIRRYWQMEFPSADEFRLGAPHPDDWYADQLLELLDDAVRIRLRADVPVGAYLSGGLDSSVVTALARRQIGGQLKTFSIGFESSEFDESQFQSSVVSHLGTEHRAFVCRGADIGEAFPSAIWHTERPILRTAPVPMMLLSRGVRAASIKVVLTGEGADEILAGYDLFKEAKIRRFWARAPHSRWRPLLLRRLYPYLTGLQHQSPAYLKAFFGHGLEQTADPLYSHRPRWQSTAPLKNLFSDELRERLRGYDPIDEVRQQLPAEFVTWHPLAQAQYLETAFLLPGYILSSQGDRMGMANSVEGRFPFLDHRVAAFAATIPPHVKLKGLREKHVLRQAAAGLLPDAIVNRVKQPYRAPDHLAFVPQGRALDYVEERLAPDALAESGCFAAAPIRALLAKCRRQENLGARDSMGLVGALSVQMLYQQFIKRDVALEVPFGKIG